MRPGAIHREAMSFARVRASGDAAAQVKEIKRILDAEIAADKKQKPRFNNEEMVLESLQDNVLLFYHAPRLGSEYEYDDFDSIHLWDTYAYQPSGFAAFLKLVEATESLDRDVQIRWGSVEAGSVANISLTLVGSDHQIPGSAYSQSGRRFSYSTGEYYWDDEAGVLAFQPERQIAGLRAMIESLSAGKHYQDLTVDGLSRPVFAPKLATSPGEVTGYVRADLALEGKRFVAGMHESMKQGGDSLFASLFSDDLPTTTDGLNLLRKVVNTLSKALGPPSDMTIAFECIISDWPTQSQVLEKVGMAFPLVSILLPYKRGFRPLAPQKVAKGEVHAYPLLLLKRHRAGTVPIRPLLAVNAVHANDGLWIELQSSGRTDLIDRAAQILGGKPEYWKGPPDIRWGWYPDRSFPGLPHGNCAQRNGAAPAGKQAAPAPAKPTAKGEVKTAVKRAPANSPGNQSSKRAAAASKSPRATRPAKDKTPPKKASVRKVTGKTPAGKPSRGKAARTATTVAKKAKRRAKR